MNYHVLFLTFFFIHINLQEISKMQVFQHLDETLSSLTPQQLTHFQNTMDQQSRKIYQRYKQQRDLRKTQQKEEYEKLKQDAEPTPQGIKIIDQEQLKIANLIEQQRYLQDIIHETNTFSFDINEKAFEDFKISIPHAQPIYLLIKVYQNNDRVYSDVTTAADKEPLWLYIYQNGHKLIYQNSFYSTQFVKIEGKDNSTYRFRFLNQGIPRLLTMDFPHITQEAHIAQALRAEDVAGHATRIQQVSTQIEKRFNSLGTQVVLQHKNRSKLSEDLQKYYWYNLIQISVLVVLCIIQVESIRKLLIPQGII